PRFDLWGRNRRETPLALPAPQKISPHLFPHPQNLPHNASRPSCRERSGVVRKRGRTGASGGGLTRPAARGGRAQGFPRRHYGRCVLDEHIAGEAMPKGPKSPRQSVSKAERNGRGQKSPDGRPRGRVKI